MSAAPSDAKALEAAERKVRKAADTRLAILPDLWSEALRANGSAISARVALAPRAAP